MRPHVEHDDVLAAVVGGGARGGQRQLQAALAASFEIVAEASAIGGSPRVAHVDQSQKYGPILLGSGAGRRGADGATRLRQTRGRV